MSNKQIVILVTVREEYGYSTEGNARIEMDIPESLLESVDITGLANALLAEARRENNEKIAQEQREAAEKELAEAAAAAGNGHADEPIPA